MRVSFKITIYHLTVLCFRVIIFLMTYFECLMNGWRLESQVSFSQHNIFTFTWMLDMKLCVSALSPINNAKEGDSFRLLCNLFSFTLIPLHSWKLKENDLRFWTFSFLSLHTCKLMLSKNDKMRKKINPKLIFMLSSYTIL